jgi:hypothetical protein
MTVTPPGVEAAIWRAGHDIGQYMLYKIRDNYQIEYQLAAV